MPVTRRPYSGSSLINYEPVTSILTKNSMTITRHSGGDLDGKINTVEISDDYIKKTLTMVYSGTSLMGFSTIVEEI